MPLSTSVDHGGAGRVRDENAFDVEFCDGARYFEGRCLALIGD